MHNDPVSRRGFLASAGVSTFTILRPELARGAGKERLKVGLVGCGLRGTHATCQLLAGSENVELLAMGDLFEDKLADSLAELRDASRYPAIQAKIKVDQEHRFVGFDAYKKVIASDVDVVLLCTPPGYRPMHFEAAIDAGKHVFAEKPIATDPVGVRCFMTAARKAEQRKLTVMSGAQRRSSQMFIDTVEKIQGGAIGDIVAGSSWYLSEPVFHAKARDPKWGDMEWQNRNWYSFVWLCGDQVVEQHFHNLDTMNWVMGTHPVKVVAVGGAAWRPKEECYGNIYDHMSCQFVYPNGVIYSTQCRQYPTDHYWRSEDLIIGTRGRSNCHDKSPVGRSDSWTWPEPYRDTWSGGPEAYAQEHINMVKSIRGEGPYLNFGMAVAESTMTGIMARESAYSGQEVTWERIMASQLDLMPKAFDYKMKMETPQRPVPGTYRLL